MALTSLSTNCLLVVSQLRVTTQIFDLQQLKESILEFLVNHQRTWDTRSMKLISMMELGILAYGNRRCTQY